MTQIPDQSAPEDAASELALAAGRFFPDGVIAAATGSRRLVRVESPSGLAVIREWPDETTRDHVAFVHALHATVHAANLPYVAPMLPLAGEQATVLALNGRLYDARAWLPGEPLGETAMDEPAGEPVDLPTVVSDAALAATIKAVARFHQASTALTRHDQELTIRQLRQAARQLWQVHRDRLRPAAPSYPAIQHWLRTGERALPMALALIDQEPDLAQSTSVVGHNRLWPAHVLRQGATEHAGATGEACYSERREESLSSSAQGNERFLAAARNDKGITISELVGLSDPAWGSPLLDLAQIGTRFARWSPELVEALIGGYSAVRQLIPAERRLLPAVATLDGLIQAGRLLDFAYGPTRTDVPPPASSPVVVAAELLIVTLEAVSETMSALTPRDRPSGPRWRRGPRRSGPPARSGRGRLRQRRDHLT